jgi:hypothetical protein
MHPTPLPGDGSPAVHVSLRLDAPVAAALAADGRLREAAAEGVRHSIGEVVARLGVPGTVAVDLDPQPGPDDHRPDLLALTVNGRSCHFSDDVLVLARSYAVAEFAAGTPADAAQWARRAAGSASSGDQERFVEFLASVCAEAVSRQASVLLGPAQVGAYQQQLGGLAADLALGGASLDARRLRPILARLLDLRISVADRATVARVLALGANAPWEDVAEELVDALAPPAVELLVPPEYVAALTASSPGEANLVDYVREGVYDTLGVVVPQVRVAAADALKSNSFRLVINHLPGQPVVGLGPGELVVNAAPEHLESGDGAVRPAVLPGTPYPAAVVRATVRRGG